MEEISLKYKHLETGLEFEQYEKTGIAIYVNGIRTVIYQREDFESKCHYRNLQHLFFWNLKRFEETCDAIAEVWTKTGMLMYQKKLTALQNLMDNKDFSTTESKFGNQNCHSASSNATGGIELKYKRSFFKRILKPFHVEYFFVFTSEEVDNLSVEDRYLLQEEYPYIYKVMDMTVYAEKITNIN